MSLAPGNAERSIVGYFTGDIPEQAICKDSDSLALLRLIQFRFTGPQCPCLSEI